LFSFVESEKNSTMRQSSVDLSMPFLKYGLPDTNALPVRHQMGTASSGPPIVTLPTGVTLFLSWSDS